MRPRWDRLRAPLAAGRLAAAVVLCAALAGCEEPAPGPEPTDEPEPVNTTPEPRSIVGTWRGQTQSPGVGVVFVETIFGGNGLYSQSNYSQSGAVAIRVTGEYVLAEDNVIQVSKVRTDPRFPIDYVLLRYTWVDANTLRLQDLGCLNYAPELCGAITYTRAR